MKVNYNLGTETTFKMVLPGETFLIPGIDGVWMKTRPIILKDDNEFNAIRLDHNSEIIWEDPTEHVCILNTTLEIRS